VENTKVVKATKDLVETMIGNLREEDNKECLDSTGRTADIELMNGFHFSEKCWVGLVEGEAFCCFGVTESEQISKIGVPWMLATNTIKIKKAKILVRQVSKIYVRNMMIGFQKLENWVSIDNKISIEWLEWCGFNLEKPMPYGREQKLFHRFWMTKNKKEA